MTIPVVVLNWNGFDDTVECVEALCGMRHDDFHVYLIDNGSEPDESAALAQQFADRASVSVERNDSNLGFTRGVNKKLIEILGNDEGAYIALLNNDAIPDEGWLAALEACARESGAEVVASRMLRYDDPERIDNAGHMVLTTGEILPRGTGRCATEYAQQTEVVGACAGAVLLSRSLLNEIGIFDLYFVTGYEDAEFGLRAQMAGYPTTYCPQAVVRHKISRSVDRIRDFRFAVKLQQDIYYTWYKLAPTGLLVLTMPLLFLRLLVILVVGGLIGRGRLVKVQWRAFVNTVREWPRLREARREAGVLRKLSSLALLRRQTSFLRVYGDYFNRYFLHRQKTVFER